MTNREIVAGIAFSQSRISISPHTKTVSNTKTKQIPRHKKNKVQLALWTTFPVELKNGFSNGYSSRMAFPVGLENIFYFQSTFAFEL